MALALIRGGSCSRWRNAIASLRAGPLAGLWLFVWVFLAQLGHLIEHIAKAITGAGLLGSSFDSEVSHLLFNGAIAVLAVVLVLVYPRNPWVYPLAAISILHGIEHVYIFEQFLRTGLSNGPGLLGEGGAIGLIPLDRLDVHNVYNGFEVVFLTLGFGHELDRHLTTAEV